MGRRSDIDWERVERLYIAGQMTIREIASECKINPSSITAKAKQLGWQRNLAEAIKERTKTKIAQIDVQALIDESAQQSAQKSAQTVQKAIEEAANIGANVRLRQRSDLRVESDRAESIQKILEDHLSSLDGIGDVAKASIAFKNLMDTKLKIQEREDKIFGLNEKDNGDPDDGQIEISVELVGTNGSPD